MSFEIHPYTWTTGTRPCSFTLALDGGSVFADFEVDPDGLISLLCISFDGYGDWRPVEGQRTTTMDVRNAAALQRAREDEALNSDEVRTLLRRYFHANSGLIWSDALEQYGLLLPEATD
ncbi:MAG: hypothetical protein AAF467_12085 [Actinomycetota bacterium]